MHLGNYLRPGVVPMVLSGMSGIYRANGEKNGGSLWSG